MQNFYQDDRSKNKERVSFQDGHQLSRATTPGRSLVESLKPISRKFDLKEGTLEPKNDLTKHFKDFMSTSSLNLKRARSSSQPKESERDKCRIKLENNKITDKYQSYLYFDTMIGKEHMRKIFTNENTVFDYRFDHDKTDPTLVDTNNNKNKCSAKIKNPGSEDKEKESVREKIIYSKSKTTPLTTNFRSESKSYVEANGTYSQPSLSEEQKSKKSLYITSKFSVPIDNCQPFKDNVTRNNMRVSSRLNRDSWHRIHKTFSCNKIVYPMSCETFL